MTFPYSMLEPIRDLLDAGIQSDRGDKDERWPISLREQIRDAEVDVSCELVRATTSLRQLTQLKAGDVIPVNLPRTLDLCLEDIPLFRASSAIPNRHNALPIHDVLLRPP